MGRAVAILPLAGQEIPLFTLLPKSALEQIITMLHLVGLGLADETDITVRGLEIVKRAERVYLEAYTSILLVDKAKLVSGTLLLFFLMKTTGNADC